MLVLELAKILDGSPLPHPGLTRHCLETYHLSLPVVWVQGFILRIIYSVPAFGSPGGKHTAITTESKFNRIELANEF